MVKKYVYNFNGTVYETTEAFDDTYRKLKAEAVKNGEPFSRQVIDGDKIINQRYNPAGIWVDE